MRNECYRQRSRYQGPGVGGGCNRLRSDREISTAREKLTVVGVGVEVREVRGPRLDRICGLLRGEGPGEF